MTLWKLCPGTPSILRVLALVLIAGCIDAPVFTEPAATPNTTPVKPVTPPTPDTSTASRGGVPLMISGIMGAQHEAIRLFRSGVPVIDAEVTVNGSAIPHCCGDLYSGDLPAPLPAGSTLNLKVVTDSTSVAGFGEVIDSPVITAPAAGSVFTTRDSITVAWSSSADPDLFGVCVNCWDNSFYGAVYYTSGSAREFKVSPGDLVDFGTGTVVAVYAYKNDFLNLGDSFGVTSKMQFMSRSPDLLITIK